MGGQDTYIPVPVAGRNELSVLYDILEYMNRKAGFIYTFGIFL